MPFIHRHVWVSIATPREKQIFYKMLKSQLPFFASDLTWKGNPACFKPIWRKIFCKKPDAKLLCYQHLHIPPFALLGLLLA